MYTKTKHVLINVLPLSGIKTCRYIHILIHYKAYYEKSKIQLDIYIYIIICIYI